MGLLKPGYLPGRRKDRQEDDSLISVDGHAMRMQDFIT